MNKIMVGIYIRYSSKLQTENSVEGQRRVILEYVERMGFEVADEYVDRATSGKFDKRKNFKRMIDDAKQNKFKYILVYKLDRFFRNEQAHREYEKILEEHGVEILSATESVNKKSLGEKLLKTFTLTINEHESSKISENVIRGQKELAYKAQWCGGTTPLGFDVDKNTKKLIVNKEEAKIVRYAFKLRSQGFSYTYIIEKLNKKGYKTKKGNVFVKNSLSDLFRNIKYKGIYEFNKAVAKSKDGKFNRHKSKDEDEIIRIENGCPTIVSPEIWDKVNEINKKNSKDINPRGDYLLSGLVTCKCGARMQVNKRPNKDKNKEYISFFCPEHKNKNGCDAKEIKLRDLTEFVLFSISQAVFSEETIKNFLNDFDTLNSKKDKNTKNMISQLKNQIKLNKSKIDNCVTTIENGCNSIMSKKLEDRVEELDNEMKALNKKIEKLEKTKIQKPTEEEIKQHQNSFVEFMQKESNLPMAKDFLQKVIEKILVTDEKVTVRFKI